jgi:glutamine amidotransferase
MKLSIIDYGSGNLRSVAKSFERVAAGNDVVHISSDPRDLDTATHIVLPGVGAFGDCIQGLTAIPGMCEALERNVRERQKPFLGICVGMQLLAEQGFEHGAYPGLGWIKGDVIAIPPAKDLKIPHM